MKADFSRQPFVLLIIPIITGILLGKFIFNFEIALWVSVTFFCLFLLSFVLIKQKILSFVLLLTTLMFLMAVRWNAVYNYSENHIALQNFKNVNSVSGMVIESKYKRDNRNRYVISVKHAKINNQQIKVQGKMLLNTIRVDQKFAYGDLLDIKCKLQKPKGQRNPGQFDYKNYLADKDIFLISYINHIDSIEVLKHEAGNLFIQNAIEPVKNFFVEALETCVSWENSPVLKALLLGEKQGLDVDLIERFKNVGVVHVLAISGLHVGFIIIFVMVILSLLRLKYNHQIYLLLIILFIYVVIINFKAPVMRASLMAAFYFLAKLSEKKVSLYNIIFFVAFFLLIIDPRDLFAPGFQFSFTAVLSIVYGYKKLNSYFPLKSKINFKKNRLLKKFFTVFIWDAFLVSIAAVLGTLPLTIYYYGVFPTYAVLANIFVIPLIGLVVMAGLLMSILYIFSPLLAAVLGNFIDLIFDLLKWVISYFYNLPYSYFHSSTPSVMTILLSLLLVYLVFNIVSRKHQIIALGVLLLIVFMNISIENGAGDVEVTFLDVGQGDAAFVKFPNDESMLVDGGDATKNWDQGKNTILPFLKYENISHLRYVVASHPHNDHIGGLTEILKSINVDTLILSAYEFTTKKYKEMINVCRVNDIAIRYVGKGNQLFPDSSCRVYILHPSAEYVEEHDFSGEECNNSSIVMKIQYGENGILFTGDAEKDAEKAYTKYGDFLESEILKTGHHGSRTSTTQKMLEFVQPLSAVISVAEWNKFKHPSPITLRKFKYNHIKPFLTSKQGAVQFRVTPDKIFLIHRNKNAAKIF